MAFLIYEKQGNYLIPTGEYYSLAGYNLIYNLWEKRKKPTDEGWHMSADDLIQEYTEGKGNIETHSLLIDFHPGATRRIGIIELLDIYAYTYSGSSDIEAAWTPMMLRLREVFYKDDYKNEITRSEKEATLKKLAQPSADADDFVEFLYLNGNDKGWNWGRNGMVNAAFIHAPARAYFKKYF